MSMDSYDFTVGARVLTADGQDVGQIAAFLDTPSLVGQDIVAAPPGARGELHQRVDWAGRGVAKKREHGHAAAVVDGVIAPFAPCHAAAVDG